MIEKVVCEVKKWRIPLGEHAVVYYPEMGKYEECMLEIGEKPDDAYIDHLPQTGYHDAAYDADDMYVINGYPLNKEMITRCKEDVEYYLLDMENKVIRYFKKDEPVDENKVVMAKSLEEYLELMNSGERIPYKVACFMSGKQCYIVEDDKMQECTITNWVHYGLGSRFTIKYADGQSKELSCAGYGKSYCFKK